MQPGPRSDRPAQVRSNETSQDDIDQQLLIESRNINEGIENETRDFSTDWNLKRSHPFDH